MSFLVVLLACQTGSIIGSDNIQGRRNNIRDLKQSNGYHYLHQDNQYRKMDYAPESAIATIDVTQTTSVNPVQSLSRSQIEVLQILYSMDQNKASNFAPVVEGLLQNQGDKVIFEVPLLDFGQLSSDYCNEDERWCNFFEMGQRYLWNNETQQCEGVIACQGTGFDQYQNCQSLAPYFCLQ